MSKKYYAENTIYLRQRGDDFECFGNARGKSMVLENLSSEEMAIKCMTFLLWAVNEFGPDEYGAKMQELDGAPEGVEFPVVDEGIIEKEI